MEIEKKWILQQINKLDTLETMLLSSMHDINNIITIIELQTYGKMNESFTNKINYLANLAKGLQIYTHKETQKKIPCLINDYLQYAINLCYASIKHKLTIELNAKEENIFVLANPSDLQQLIVNLLLNTANTLRDRERPVLLSIDTQKKTDKVLLILKTIEAIPQRLLPLPVHHLDENSKSNLAVNVINQLLTELNGSLHIEGGISRESRLVIKLPHYCFINHVP